MAPNGAVDDCRSLRREALWLPIIMVVAAILRYWALNSVPPGYHYDEAFEGLEAWKLVSQAGYHPVFFTGNFGVEPLFIYLTSVAFRVAESCPTVQRGVAAFLGALTVPTVYLLATELRLMDRRVPRAFPMISAASLAVMYPHVHFSRVGIEPVLVPFLFCCGFWGLFRGLRTGRLGPCIVSGICLGMGPYAYPAGRLLLPLAVGLFIGMLFLDVAWLRGRWPLWVLVLLVGLAVFAPLAVHFARNPQLLTLRASQVAVGSGQQGSLGQNVLRTLGMFSFVGDLDPRNNLPGRPFLDWWSGALFYVGVVATVWRILERRSGRTEDELPARAVQDGDALGRTPGHPGRTVGLFLLLSLATLSLPTALSEYAPHFRRAIGVSAPAALLVGVGLACSASWAKKLFVRGRPSFASAERGATLLLAVPLLGGSAFLTARDYFVRWGESPETYYAYDVGLWEIGQYVNELPAQEQVYVSPRPATHMTLAFAWRQGRSTRHFDGRSAFVARPNARGDGRPATYIIIVHEDFRGGQLLEALYPEAARVRAFLDRDGQVYAEALHVEDTSALSRRPHTERLAVWEGIRLLGYDVDRDEYHPGETVYLQLWWSAEARTPQNWTVFTHLLGPARPDGSTVWAGHDSEPGEGSVPTSTWEPGELILDEHQLVLPQEIAGGTYTLEIGLYDGATGVRAEADVSPLDGAEASGNVWEKADRVILGALQIE
jgi:hypothetical protein